jgi:uncharacterized glyoxalase superfamily protein PhnB
MTTEADVFPLLWAEDVQALVDWAVSALGLTVAWTAPGEDGRLEHAEVLWPGGRVSINVRREEFAHMGPSGISLRFDDRDRVDSVCQRARDAGAEIIQGPEESRVAYSFTAVDPDGNQWWVNAETGMLDGLREGSAREGDG